MGLFFDSFWRAAAYCLHPRVIWLSLLPIIILSVLGLAAGYFFWEDAIEGVRVWLNGSVAFQWVMDVLSRFGLSNLRSAVAPVLVVSLLTPVFIVLVLLMVAVLMTPALVKMVIARRFESLQSKADTGFVTSVMVSLGWTALALLALHISMPLWLVPPLIMILPPLIWGWLTYKVMSFDALSGHASKDERHIITREHRLYLLAIGVITGYLGAAPTLIWVVGGVWAAVMAPLLIPFALWLYTLVFAFSALWFVHYCLAALHQLRQDQAGKDMPITPEPPAQITTNIASL